MPELNDNVATEMDAKAVVVKAKKKAPARKKPVAKVAETPVVEKAKTKLVRVKLNFDTVNPLSEPAFDKASGRFSVTHDNVFSRGSIVEVSEAVAAQWVNDRIPMGYKGRGVTEGNMGHVGIVYKPRAEYV